MAQARHPLLLTAAGFPISLPTPVPRTAAKTVCAAGKQACIPPCPSLSSTAGCPSRPLRQQVVLQVGVHLPPPFTFQRCWLPLRATEPTLHREPTSPLLSSLHKAAGWPALLLAPSRCCWLPLLAECAVVHLASAGCLAPLTKRLRGE